MRIGDVMAKELPTVEPEDSVRDAACRMTEAGVQALPVCHGERLEGIITDWDVTRAMASAEDASGKPLREYMSTDLVATQPDARLGDVSELMADRRIHHVLVCDGDRLAGMVHLDVEWSQMGGLETPTASFSSRI
ncbi:MAG TPA: CBS domain-containing protein [Thermoleophilaceae bacterium]|nr:CBS domain-containing protein [Thermoleophilaceae bacterium]